MIRLILFFSFLLFSSTSFAQKYKPVDAGSKIHFVIDNFGIGTGGDLSGLTGDINFTTRNLLLCNFTVSVNVNTIDTDNESRDKSLKRKEYFDAEKFPLITITSTKINRTNKTHSGWYYFTGSITIRGVTKPIEFPFTATAKNGDFLFVGGFTINRLDFGVGTTSAVLSNNVKISLSVLAKKS